MNWLSRLKAGLSKSSSKLSEGISTIFTHRKLDDAMLEELEDLLVMADLGSEVASRVVARFGRTRFGKDISSEEVKNALAQEIAEVLRPVAIPLSLDKPARPQVVMMVGVNGNGKTTTLGKLALRARQQGKKVMLVACDTFRAAAAEQLAVWAERSGCELVRGNPQADPASVAYTALEKARAEEVDIVFIDTAGRLQNKAGLMEELVKIMRVLKKLDPDAPHDTVLVLDGTTGQNAHKQAEVFSEMVQISGLIVTKLDGTAKGGVVVALAERFGLPIHAVGVGESIEDLQPFEPEGFARSLLG
ncbi:MAG: signal recognition particle-docking protein FtsY [Hyphomicrobiales bacterium]|nr:signal recognition particle-docking protein FtsY [Hyphomicrobiales bacterium]